MKQYKGYYIDHFYFHSEADIEAFVKQQAIDRYKLLCRQFAYNSSMELSVIMSNLADRLHNIFGMDYNEIEALEIESFQAA